MHYMDIICVILIIGQRGQKIYFNVLDDNECEGMFDCGNGECISHEMACDGCSNKKDEQICTDSQGNSYADLLCVSVCRLLHLFKINTFINVSYARTCI